MTKEDLLRNMKEKIELTIIYIIALIVGIRFSEYFAISSLHECISEVAICVGLSFIYSMVFMECCKPDKE